MKIKAFLIISIFLVGFNSAALSNNLRLAGSIYVGWMPWFYADQEGILQKNAKLAGHEAEFVPGDYIETINQFALGGVDAVVLTNIDAMALLVGNNVETDVILIGSYSNGNDAILLKPQAGNDIVGKTLGLVEYSVSHYLLDRYLEKSNIPFGKVKWRNYSDAAIASSFIERNSELAGVVTWNPIANLIESSFKGNRLFDSASIKNEIADMLVIRRESLKKNPEFGCTLLKTWFEVTEQMNGPNKKKVYDKLGALEGGDGASYAQQLKTTTLIDSKEKALDALADKDMQGTMGHVEAFVKRHKLLSVAPEKPWISYHGEKSAVLHFNSEALKKCETL